MAKKVVSKKEPMTMIHKSDLWSEELEMLYGLVRSTELVETIKWGGPCFTINGKLVLGIGAFKSYVGIWFHQGVFLKDPKKVLINANEEKTKALRQWRFFDKNEIDLKLIRSYVLEAIENAKAGKELKPEKKKTGELPVELKQILDKNKKLGTQFNLLTPFKQREYIEYIADAKQEKTRISRVEKSVPLILEGKGLNDKYR